MPVVSNPLRIAWQNWAGLTTTTVVASNELAALPASFVQNQIPSKAWHANPSTIQTLDFDFQSALTVRQFAARNHNFTAGATITISGATNSTFSPVAVTAGVTVADGLLLHQFESDETYQFWRLSIDDRDNTNDSWFLGHVFLGPYSEFDFPDAATVIQNIDPSVKRFSFGGSMAAFKKPKFRSVEFGLSMVQQADRRVLESIYDNVGITDGVYVFLDPNNLRDSEDAVTGKDGLHRMTIFGVFTGVFEVVHRSIDWHSPSTLTLEELR